MNLMNRKYSNCHFFGAIFSEVVLPNCLKISFFKLVYNWSDFYSSFRIIGLISACSAGVRRRRKNTTLVVAFDLKQEVRRELFLRSLNQRNLFIVYET